MSIPVTMVSLQLAKDCKVTSRELVNSQEVIAISGPSHQSQPPFNWDKFPTVAHEGMPSQWLFDWQIMRPASQ